MDRATAGNEKHVAYRGIARGRPSPHNEKKVGVGETFKSAIKPMFRKVALK